MKAEPKQRCRRFLVRLMWVSKFAIKLLSSLTLSLIVIFFCVCMICKSYKLRHYRVCVKIYHRPFYYFIYNMTDKKLFMTHRQQHPIARTQFLHFLLHEVISYYCFSTSCGINNKGNIGACTLNSFQRVEKTFQRKIFCVKRFVQLIFSVQTMSFRLSTHRLLKHGRRLLYNCFTKRNIHIKILEPKNNRLLSSGFTAAKKVSQKIKSSSLLLFFYDYSMIDTWSISILCCYILKQ